MMARFWNSFIGLGLTIVGMAIAQSNVGVALAFAGVGLFFLFRG